MTEPIMMKGKSHIKGLKERLKYALKVLIYGDVDISIDAMYLYKTMIENLDRERAHKLRKLTQKIERKA